MDYYSILGVSKDATTDEIKKAYRKLAMQHHPDKGGDVSKFQEITTAYETLSDTDKRFQYDNPSASPMGHHPGVFNFGMNEFDLNDLFGQIFGRQGHPFASQTPVYRTRVAISLTDAYHGSDFALKLNTPDGMKAINIKIPPGIDTGNQIRYDNVIPNTQLIVEFHVNGDARFERRGYDLYSVIPVSVLDLIVGTEIEVGAINGKTLRVVVKPRTQPSQQIRLPGQGMPIGNGNFGDQIVLIKPVIPDNIPDDVIEIITKTKTKGK